MSKFREWQQTLTCWALYAYVAVAMKNTFGMWDGFLFLIGFGSLFMLHEYIVRAHIKQRVEEIIEKHENN